MGWVQLFELSWAPAKSCTRVKRRPGWASSCRGVKVSISVVRTASWGCGGSRRWRRRDKPFVGQWLARPRTSSVISRLALRGGTRSPLRVWFVSAFLSSPWVRGGWNFNPIAQGTARSTPESSLFPHNANRRPGGPFALVREVGKAAGLWRDGADVVALR